MREARRAGAANCGQRWRLRRGDLRREQAFEGFAGVEVLVCNAALRPHKPVWEIDYEEWHQVLHKGTPQAMANAALLLASDEPSFVTGGRYM